MKKLTGSSKIVPTTTGVQREYFNQLVEKYGCPLEAMFIMGANEMNTSELRLRAFTEAAQYGMSKLKSVELTGADGGPLEVKMALVDKLANALNTLSAAEEVANELVHDKADYEE